MIKSVLNGIVSYGFDDVIQNRDKNSCNVWLEEAIACKNGITVHGIVCLNRTINFDDLRIDVLDETGTRVSGNYHCYVLDDYFDDSYDQQTKTSLAFSISISHNCNDYIIKGSLKSNSRSAFVYFMQKSELENLVMRSGDINLSFQERIKLLNRLYEKQKATKSILAEQKNFNFHINPLFSIVVPLYNTPENYFIEMIESVLSQTYANFELILVNASPESSGLRKIVNYYKNLDTRINVIDLILNEGIMKNTNVGIEAAKGDYVCFLDHDDVLEPDILFHYAKAINDDFGSTGLLYCDDIILDENGDVCGTFLVGDFSIDSLLHRNYLGHMLAIRKDILDKIDTDTSIYDGAQDHYMSLMASLQTKHIVHIDRALYKWRRSSNSTSANPESKKFGIGAGIRSVKKYLDSAGISALVREASRPFSYAVDYEIHDVCNVTVVIDITSFMRSITNVIRTANLILGEKNRDIVFIGKKSNNTAIYKKLDECNRVTYITAENKYEYVRCMNSISSGLRGEFLFFLDCNVVIENENQIRVLLERMQRKDVGAVAPMLIYPDQTIASAGMAVLLPKPNHISRGLSVEVSGYMDFNYCDLNYSAVSGLCMMTRKEDFISAGGFSEEFNVNYFDVDYCLKLRNRNLLIVYTPEINVVYDGNFIIKDLRDKQSQLSEILDRSVLVNKWHTFFIGGDPYINKNFENTSSNTFLFLPKV